MDWYYVVDQDRVGPVDGATIAALIKSGRIDKNTLVWNETLTDWTPLKKVNPSDIPKDEPEIEPEAGLKVEPLVEADPYTAPKSDIKPREKYDEKGFSDPLRVPVTNGIKWITRAFSLFLKNPFKWLFILFLCMVFMMVLSLIPFIGPLIQLFLYPVIGAGLIIGAKAQDDGEDLMVKHLFEGFSNNLGQLVLFGFFYFLFMLLILVVIGASMAMFVGISGMSEFFNTGTNPAQIAQNLPIAMIIIFLIAFALMIPVLMMYYFAPALIAINSIPATAAMIKSFRACLINFFPFLFYGLIYILLWVGMMALVGGLTFIFGSMGKTAIMFLPMLILIIIGIVVGPVTIISTYTSYKDIFYK